MAITYKKILVVDDEQDITRQIKKALSSLGYIVDITYNGKEAMDKMENMEVYDLLILAILIPKLNGIEVLKEIIEDERLKKTPVLLVSVLPLTSDAFQKSLKKFKEFVVVRDILEKPFSSKDLLAKVETIIGANLR